MLVEKWVTVGLYFKGTANISEVVSDCLTDFDNRDEATNLTTHLSPDFRARLLQDGEETDLKIQHKGPTLSVSFRWR